MKSASDDSWQLFVNAGTDASTWTHRCGRSHDSSRQSDRRYFFLSIVIDNLNVQDVYRTIIKCICAWLCVRARTPPFISICTCNRHKYLSYARKATSEKMTKCPVQWDLRLCRCAEAVAVNTAGNCLDVSSTMIASVVADVDRAVSALSPAAARLQVDHGLIALSRLKLSLKLVGGHCVITSPVSRQPCLNEWGINSRVLIGTHRSKWEKWRSDDKLNNIFFKLITVCLWLGGREGVLPEEESRFTLETSTYFMFSIF